MIILEFDDYMDVYDTMEVIEEGLFDKLKEKLRRGILSIFGKNYLKQMNELIASKEIIDLIDEAKGKLTNDVVSDKDLSDPNVPVGEIINKYKEAVPTGQLFHQTLDALGEEMKIRDDILKMQIAIEELEKQGGHEDEVKVKEKEMQGLVQRGQELQKAMGKKREQLEKNLMGRIDEFKKKVGEKKLPMLEADIARRLNLAKTVSLLIEYDLRKKRFTQEDIGNLQKEMVNTYKKSLQSAKDLEQQMSGARDEVGTPADKEVKEKYKVGQKLSIQARPDKPKIEVQVLEFQADGVLVGIMGDNDQVKNKKTFSYPDFKKFAEIGSGEGGDNKPAEPEAPAPRNVQAEQVTTGID